MIKTLSDAACSADFTIARRDIADASVTLGDALTYDTTEQTQTVRAVHFDGVDVSYTVGTGSDKATNAGNYTLRLIGTGNVSDYIKPKAAAQPVADSFTPEAEDDEDLPF